MDQMMLVVLSLLIICLFDRLFCLFVRSFVLCLNQLYQWKWWWGSFVAGCCAVVADYLFDLFVRLFFVCCWFLLHTVGSFVTLRYVTLLESHKTTQETRKTPFDWIKRASEQAINRSHVRNKQTNKHTHTHTHKFGTNKAHQARVVVRSPSFLIYTNRSVDNSSTWPPAELKKQKQTGNQRKRSASYCCFDSSLFCPPLLLLRPQRR